MTTINTIGRITKDFELKTSEKSGHTYAQFSIAVNDGFGDNQKPMYFECVVFGVDAERLIKAKAKKGSLLQVSGKFSTAEFPRANGQQGYSLKIAVHAWAYIPGTNGKKESTNGNNGADNGNTHVPNQPPEEYYPEGDYNGMTNLDDEYLND